MQVGAWIESRLGLGVGLGLRLGFRPGLGVGLGLGLGFRPGLGVGLGLGIGLSAGRCPEAATPQRHPPETTWLGVGLGFEGYPYP